LEQDLGALRAKKAQLPEDDYYRQVEGVLVQIARLYSVPK
jgi:hypothetical protein